ncbi:unnamed protein product [Vitrella brassicaformis CCMP3155]|uniref:Peroxin-13 n=2 Tax=Vitrella brassicaformis TaxID=1169539 RepID=A0A0G4EA36_VITBC|nr:unnamed protein product [Vitrella brassicaformis CCMP3155]|eukprot:CEL92096.1 unnamed protein product [Vitrella brassicaformis CCMP3155]
MAAPPKPWQRRTLPAGASLAPSPLPHSTSSPLPSPSQPQPTNTEELAASSTVPAPEPAAAGASASVSNSNAVVPFTRAPPAATDGSNLLPSAAAPAGAAQQAPGGALSSSTAVPSYMSSYPSGTFMNTGYGASYSSYPQSYNRPSAYSGYGWRSGAAYGGYGGGYGGYSTYGGMPYGYGYGMYSNDGSWFGGMADSLGHFNQLLDLNTWFLDQICDNATTLGGRLRHLSATLAWLPGALMHLTAQSYHTYVPQAVQLAQKVGSIVNFHAGRLLLLDPLPPPSGIQDDADNDTTATILPLRAPRTNGSAVGGNPQEPLTFVKSTPHSRSASSPPLPYSTTDHTAAPDPRTCATPTAMRGGYSELQRRRRQLRLTLLLLILFLVYGVLALLGWRWVVGGGKGKRRRLWSDVREQHGAWQQQQQPHVHVEGRWDAHAREWERIYRSGGGGRGVAPTNSEGLPALGPPVFSQI